MSAAASARPFGVPALQIAGWYCSAGREVVDWAMVACMPDWLKLVIGDSALDKSFAPHRGQAHLLRPAQPDTRSDAGARDEIAPARATKLKAALCVRVPAR